MTVEVTKKQMKIWIRILDKLPCTFWGCEGSRKNNIKDAITCTKCMVVHEMREAVKKG